MAGYRKQKGFVGFFKNSKRRMYFWFRHLMWKINN